MTRSQKNWNQRYAMRSGSNVVLSIAALYCMVMLHWLVVDWPKFMDTLDSRFLCSDS